MANAEGMDMTTRVVERDDLERRRAVLLERAGVSYEELRRRAERSDLHGDEWAIWENLEAIDFLLLAENGDGSR